MPTRSRPRSRPWTAATASRAASTLARVRRDSSSSAWPASVSSTRRVLRSNSSASSSFSSALIEADSPDWEMNNRSEARVKCFSSATVTKCSS